jgi:hypothetical protein
VVGLRQLLAVAAGVLVFLTGSAPVRAAELKISLTELARILNITLAGTKFRAHNVPGGMINLTPGSSVTLPNGSVNFDIPGKSFTTAGTTIAYYVNELNSKSFKVSAVPSALRVTIDFEDTGPELIGRCLSGLCPSDSALPEINWNKPVLSIDLTPVWISGNLSLDVKRVDFGGSFVPDCDVATGFLSGPFCRFVLPQARTAAGKLKTELSAVLKSSFNDPASQEKLATGLRSFLKFGPVGEVRFSKVAVDADNVTLTFCLACQAQ